MNVKIKRLSEDAVVPLYAKIGDSGFDLVAVEDMVIHPGQTVKIPTGLAFEIPQGYELQIRPRSGITSKTKIRVQFGTIDSGYRGEVSITVDNIAKGVNMDFDPEKVTPNGTYMVLNGDRIAQGVIAPVIQAVFKEVDELSESERGAGGFGSTGIGGPLNV